MPFIHKPLYLCSLRIAWIVLVSLLIAFDQNRAETLRSIELRLNPGRAAHNFSIQDDSGGGMSGSATKSIVEAVSPANSYLSLSFDFDAERGFTVFDDTAGHFLFFDATTSAVLAGVVSTDSWDFNTGTARQYFLVPEERSNHSFVLAQPYGLFTLATNGPLVSYAGTTSGSSLTRREVSASYIPGYDFWLIDLNTNERSVTNARNTAISSWVANSAPLPARNVALYLGTGEDGQSFTLHSRYPGGPEQMQSVTAYAYFATPGSWDPGYVEVDGTIYTQDHAGNDLTVAPGTCRVTGMVGYGMEFWLTRDADAAIGPKMTMDSANGQWAHGAFPELAPQRPLQRISFRLPANAGWDHVGHSDGYIAPLVVDSTGWLYSYDDFGNVDQAVEYVLAHADVDNSHMWWAATSGQTAADVYATDLLNWNPTHADPPPLQPELVAVTIPLLDWNNVQLIQEGGGTPFSYDSGWHEVQWWNGYTWISVSYGGSYYWTYEAVDANGQWLYSIPCVTEYLPRIANKPFWLTASHYTTGDQYTTEANQPDQHAWFPPPASKSISISSSRWGHALYLCHPNGESYPVQQNATQGSLSFDPNQQAWWTSYYYFDANVSWRYFLDWWIEDRSVLDTNGLPERSARNATDADLINWIAVPIPKQVTGSVASDGAVQLKWPLGLACVDGAFVIERQTNDTGAWGETGTVAASSADAEGNIQFADSGLQLGRVYSYRVRYRYGGITSEPSNLVRITGWLDNNGDGIPDWQDSYVDLDDPDGDGLTNTQEIALGTNPNKKDNPSVQLTAFGFTAP